MWQRITDLEDGQRRDDPAGGQGGRLMGVGVWGFAGDCGDLLSPTLSPLSFWPSCSITKCHKLGHLKKASIYHAWVQRSEVQGWGCSSAGGMHAQHAKSSWFKQIPVIWDVKTEQL